MFYPNRTIRYEPGDRLFDTINTFLVALSSVAIAVNVRLGFSVDWKMLEHHNQLACTQFKQDVVLPLVGPVEFALEGKIPSSIEFRVQTHEPYTASIGMTTRTLPGRQIADMVLKILIPYYVEFYEHYAQWLTQNISRDFTKWPAVWQFGRRIRDVTSHGGKIKINDPNFIPVSWYNLIYGPAQNGQLVFKDQMQAGDLLILMIEMGEELDRHSCPVVPPPF